LEKAVDERNPPIICFQAYRDNTSVNWVTDFSDGHFNVVVGYDEKNLFFMDPWIEPHNATQHYRYVPKKEFQDRWHNCAASHIYHGAAFIDGKSVTPKLHPHPIPPTFTVATYEP